MKRIKLYNEETKKRKFLFAEVLYKLVEQKYPGLQWVDYSSPELMTEKINYQGTERIAIVGDEAIYLRSYLAVSTSPETGINRRLSRIVNLPANIGKHQLNTAIFALAIECPRWNLDRVNESGVLLGNRGIHFELWEAKDVRKQITAHLNIVCPAFHLTHLEQLTSKLSIHDSQSEKDKKIEIIEEAITDKVGTLFISHASEDIQFVDKLIPILDKIADKVWYDQRELLVGDSIVSKINSGLSEATTVIVVLSKNSVRKEWVLKEALSSLAIQISKKETRVLPILIDNSDIPHLLADIKYADFRHSFERGLNELVAGLQGLNRYSIYK